MSARGIDYSFSRPAPGAIKASGIDFVMRYLSDHPEKNLTLPEAKSLSDAGLSIVTVWENAADDVASGQPGGVHAATQGLVQLEECGAPEDAVIYFTVDEDVPEEAAIAYFTGVNDIMGSPLSVGVYGSGAVCFGLKQQRLATFTALAMPTAWLSAPGGWVPDIIQTGPGQLGPVPVDFDLATLFYYGQWSTGLIPGPIQDSYTVQPYDTLNAIAARYGMDWTTIWYYNISPGNRPPATIALLQQRGPSLLIPGELLLIPAR
jgi:hypothetical protein